MKKLLFLFFIFSFCFSQEEYVKSDHVLIDSYVNDDHYIIDYLFQDHKGVMHDFQMSFKKNKTDLMVEKFGIPNSLLKKSKKLDPEILHERNKIIEDKMFIAQDGFPQSLNKKVLVSYYRETVRQIADYIIDYLDKNRDDNRLNRIEMAMKFVQDIPYGIPKEQKSLFKLGYITPPEVLINGYGDCDSKTILFVCIMSYLVSEKDIVFVSTPGHIFSAIKDYNNKISKEYIPYTQRKIDHTIGGTSLQYKGETYFVCETAGPGRSNYGQAYQYQPIQLNDKEDSFFTALNKIFQYSETPSIYRPTSKIKHFKVETFDLSELLVFPGDCYHATSMKYVKKDKRRAFDYHSCFMFNPPSTYDSTMPSH